MGREGQVKVCQACEREVTFHEVSRHLWRNGVPHCGARNCPGRDLRSANCRELNADASHQQAAQEAQSGQLQCRDHETPLEDLKRQKGLRANRAQAESMARERRLAGQLTLRSAEEPLLLIPMSISNSRPTVCRGPPYDRISSSLAIVPIAIPQGSSFF